MRGSEAKARPRQRFDQALTIARRVGERPPLLLLPANFSASRMWSLARPLRSACPSLPSSSHSGPSTIAKRTIVNLKPPIVFAKRNGAPRGYTERKRYKVKEYDRLIESSKKHPVIFFQHSQFEVPRLVQLRKDITAAALRHAPKKPAPAAPSLASPTPAPVTEAPPELPKFKIIGTTYFSVALREHKGIDDATRAAIADMLAVHGAELAVLTFPDLNPPQLNAILNVFARTLPPRAPLDPAQVAKDRAEALAKQVPGRRPIFPRYPLVPELKVVGALIDGRTVRADAVPGVAQLPTLDVLRAQIVGLLSAPGSQLAAVLNEAGGAKLARTLEGFKKSLEEEQGAPADAPPS